MTPFARNRLYCCVCLKKKKKAVVAATYDYLEEPQKHEEHLSWMMLHWNCAVLFCVVGGQEKVPSCGNIECWKYHSFSLQVIGILSTAYNFVVFIRNTFTLERPDVFFPAKNKKPVVVFSCCLNIWLLYCRYPQHHSFKSIKDKLYSIGCLGTPWPRRPHWGWSSFG